MGVYEDMQATGDATTPEDYDEPAGDLTLPDWQLPFTPTPALTDEGVTSEVDSTTPTSSVPKRD